MGQSAVNQHFHLHRNILKGLRVSLPAKDEVLDFGCGDGAMVEEYRKQGFAAFGCDPNVLDSGTMRKMQGPDFPIPFPDNRFAFVFSDQVMEHVKNPTYSLREIYRVLKPGGVSLHLFPSRWKPIESHVFVPFAGVFQNRIWLSIWAHLGIRNGFQKGLTAGQVATQNHAYLKSFTHYSSSRELRSIFSSVYDSYHFAEDELLKHTYGSARRIAPLARYVPLMNTLYREFYSRAIIAYKK